MESIQIKGYQKLTRSSLFYLLRCNTQDIQYFHHYLHNDIRHRRAWSNLGIRLQSFEKVLDLLKDIYEYLLRRTNVFNRLTSFPNQFETRALRDVGKDTDLEEDTNTCEDHFRGRKHLRRRS